MKWNDALSVIANAAPLLGKILPIPGAGIAGDLIASAFGTKNTREDIAAAIAVDPDAVLKLREIESNNRTALEGQFIAANTARQLATNQTMQSEAASDKWWVSGWRPYWGFISGTAFLVLVIFVCWLAFEAIAKGKAEALTMIPQLISAFAALFAIPGAILGVASWHRGKEKRVKAGEIPQAGILDKVLRSKNAG